MKPKQLKRENLSHLGLIVIIIVAVTIISSFIFARFDLTQDRRYTLSKHTRKMVSELEDIVYFKVYLDGDLPPGFLRLRDAVREQLDDFRAYGADNIQYEFIDPAEEPDTKLRNQIFKQLYDKGLDPTNLQLKEDDGSTAQKIVWPGVLVSYRGEEMPVNILKNYVGSSAEANLNSSIQALEYELTFAMNRLITPKIPRIGFVAGHGELPVIEVDDLARSLGEFYYLEQIQLNENLYSVKDTFNQNRFELLVIAKPTKPFSEKDKFIIDQFLMGGGKILWAIDAVQVDMDSLSYSRATMGLTYNLNLDDMLFKYGVRINPNLVQDMQCAVIPVNTALVGQQPRWSPAPWLYFPLLAPRNTHPITKNLDMVKAQFASTIDTVGLDPRIHKEYLLTSSKYSRKVTAPVRIDLSMISEPLDEKRFNQPEQPIAVLLEGSFESVFKNRIAPELLKNSEFHFEATGKPSAMIIMADGDILRNHVSGTGPDAEAFPLGYDRFTKQTFGNKEFMLNCVNYLCDNKAMMEARAKEFKLRLLDKPRMAKQKIWWQMFNVLLPLVLVIGLGVNLHLLKKKAYSQTSIKK